MTPPKAGRIVYCAVVHGLRRAREGKPPRKRMAS